MRHCGIPVFLSSQHRNTTVSLARAIPDNGTFVVTDNVPYPTSPTGLQALCAIQVNVTSEVGSHFSFGLFLPDAWNKRFLWAPFFLQVNIPYFVCI